MNYVLGGYVLDAVSIGVGRNIHGKKFKAEYPDRPIRIFPQTQEEKELEQKKALEQAIAFFNGMQAKGTSEGGSVCERK